MKTLYIDVYFMINFTVDILAVFLTAKLMHVKLSIARLVLSGVVGAIIAIIELFMVGILNRAILTVIFLFSVTIIFCKGASIKRKLKFVIYLYIAMFLISGLIEYVYNLLDRYLKDIITYEYSGTNKKAIVFSLIILMIMGVLRLFVMMLSDSIEEKSRRIIIKVEDKSIEVDALIDSGNLVKDPMNMNPVIFIKRCYAEKIFPKSVIDLSDIDSLSKNFRKRIRLIPVTRDSQTHVMTGVRVDSVIFVIEKRTEEVNATIVIDKEEGTYGGYYALAPYVAICNND